MKEGPATVSGKFWKNPISGYLKPHQFYLTDNKSRPSTVSFALLPSVLPH